MLDPRISVFAPFFGVPVSTISATARLAQMGRAKVVPYFPQRIGSRYRVTFLPALQDFPSGDELADAARINQVRSEEHTSELQSLMRISYAVFCLKKKKNITSTIIYIK